MLRTAFFVLTGVIFFPGSYPADGEETKAAEKVVFHDSFAGKLAKGWTWVREEPGPAAIAVAGSALGKSWKITKDGLVIRVLPGYLHAHTNNSKNILLRSIANAGADHLAIEVVLRSDPRVPYEHAGLVWYYDDDNYVALFREFLGTRPQVLMVTEKQAKPTFHYGVHEDKTIWLRLEVANGKISGKIRGSAEDAWQTIGRSALPIPAKDSKARVGLHTGGAPEGAGRFVRFRDFRVLTIQKPKAKDEKTQDEKTKKKKGLNKQEK